MAAENILTTIESLKDQVSRDYKVEIKGIFGSITVRNGTCYKCFNCGNSMGCS